MTKNKKCNCEISYLLQERDSGAVKKLAEYTLQLNHIEDKDKIRKLKETINSKFIGAIDETHKYKKNCEYCIFFNDEKFPYCINQNLLKKHMEENK